VLGDERLQLLAGPGQRVVRSLRGVAVGTGGG